MPRATAALLLIALGLSLPSRLVAQGEDAVPPARGTVRVSLAPVWWRYDQRFGKSTPGFADGDLEPIAIDFNAESLGARQLPLLGPTETTVRSLTGLGAFALNLGHASLQLNANVRVMPLSVAVGVSRRLSLAVTVPLVRSRVEAFLTVDTTAAALGNMGWNPRALSGTAFTDFRAQVDAALAALRQQASIGPEALRAQAQGTLDALQPLLCGLYTMAGGSAADAASACYQATPAAASPFLPLAGSEAGDSLDTRLQRAQNSYAVLTAQYAGFGVALPPLDAAYGLPTDHLGRQDIQRFLADPSLPVAGDSLANVLRTRLGDVELAAAYQLAGGNRVRAYLTTTVRLPTGTVDSDRNFIDIGTGDGQLDLEVGLQGELLLGSRFSVRAAGRYGVQFADELMRRVSPPNLPLAPLAQRALLRRDLGDYAALDLVPTWKLDDAFSLGVRYALYRQGATRYRYAEPADSARIGMPASVLDTETQIRRVRVGASITYSTLSRYAAGRAQFPFTVTAGYLNTIWGRGGNVPQASLFTLVMAGYVRVHGER